MIKKFPEQKQINMDAMDIKREVKPSKKFLGKFLVKSLSWPLETKMARNINKEIIEQQRATRDDIAKILKARRCSNIGTPVFWSTPPGTVADEAKATVAMSAAIKEQELDVLFSHCLLSSSSF